MPNESGPAAGAAAPPADAARLLAVIQALLAEIASERPVRARLDDRLEADLGVDSLARMELALRIEQAFGVRLSDHELLAAESPRDLLLALRSTSPARQPRPWSEGSTTPGAPGDGHAIALPSDARTIVQVLEWHALHTPGRCHVKLLAEGRPVAEITHGSLHRRAIDLAGALRKTGLARGETVALMLPTGPSMLECFMGVLVAGGTPVPIYPPGHAAGIEEHLRRQAGILDNAQARLLICEASTLPAARILRVGSRHLRAALTPDELLLRRGYAAADAPPRAHDVALVQYTSGSTGQPKGVVLTHANLLADIRAMGEAVRATPADTFVSWLPLYHDMGLIGAWLGSLYHAIPLVLMPPQDFLARPARWLRAISDHGGTLTGAPNFAYDILASRVPDSELEGIALGTLRGAMNGSETVHAATLEAFCTRFEPRGFDRRAMWPVYGLAECGVGLSFPPLRRGARVDRIDRQALHERGVARPSADPGATPVVCSGAALPGLELRVVDERGTELPDRREGRIQFRGPAATSGYLRNAEATRRLFDGEWLETGDLGYVADGELFVTGRIKDMIKRGGHNLHPDDLESTVGALPGIRRGCVAVFGNGSGVAGARGERIVVVAETRIEESSALARLRAAIAASSIQVLGAAADDIVLVPPHCVPKTSSGKIRRSECRRRYEQGELLAHDRRVAWQLVRSWAAAVGRRARARQGRAIELAAAAWMWADFVVVALLGIAASLLPGSTVRRRLARALARGGLAMSGLRIEQTGLDPSDPLDRVVYVCNHASYLDWLVLVAALPAQARFVAKRELARSWPMRCFLARMGVRFVERVDLRTRAADADAMVRRMSRGECLVMFPEGSFGRAPGLRPFHMGAFVAAARAGVQVVPVALGGTRSALRDGSWLPRHTRITLHVDAPLKPAGSGWADAVRLRDGARERIAQHCDEPAVSR